MSWGLVVGALLLPLWLVVATGLFLYETWHEDQEHSRIPLSWAMSFGVAIECGLCGWVFFVVCILLRSAGATSVAVVNDVSTPSAVAGALACAHVGVFGLLWHQKYFVRTA
jgi:hypothetical protein